MTAMIDDSASVIDTVVGDGARIYRGASVLHSKLTAGVSIGNDTNIVRSVLGRKVAINRRSYVNDSQIGDFSYVGINATIGFSKIGKFCSIAHNVYIGGFDHEYTKVTTMPMFRFKQMAAGGRPEPAYTEFCHVGNDVWISAGAQILHKASIGDGAIVGAGAVVTKNVPPYAIVAGVPARIIKYRFSPEMIERLLKVRWWDWPKEVIDENAEWIINSDVDEKVLMRMKEISMEALC